MSDRCSKNGQGNEIIVEWEDRSIQLDLLQELIYIGKDRLDSLQLMTERLDHAPPPHVTLYSEI